MEKKMVSNAINMEFKNTVFLITPVQFSVVRVVMVFIQFSNTVCTKYFIYYFVMYMFFSTDFMGSHGILLIAQSCVIFGRFQKA